MSGTKTIGICDECRFWDFQAEYPEVWRTGVCRRHAPRPYLQPAGNDQYWALTFGDDWCGEWEAKA
jgi:hypothetical protein